MLDHNPAVDVAAEAHIVAAFADHRGQTSVPSLAVCKLAITLGAYATIQIALQLKLGLRLRGPLNAAMRFACGEGRLPGQVHP